MFGGAQIGQVAHTHSDFSRKCLCKMQVGPINHSYIIAPISKSADPFIEGLARCLKLLLPRIPSSVERSRSMETWCTWQSAGIDVDRVRYARSSANVRGTFTSHDVFARPTCSRMRATAMRAKREKRLTTYEGVCKNMRELHVLLA